MSDLYWLLSLLAATIGVIHQVQVSEPQPRRSMRILALFSGTNNELGLDHRLGRQILKSALARAKLLHPELGEVELIVHNDDTDCTSRNELPNRVAEQFYATDSARQCYQKPKSVSSLGGGCSSSNGTANSGYQLEQADREMEPTSQVQRAAVDAIIGPSCDHLVDLVARMAAYWRTPMYSVASVGAAFGHKEIYTTLTRLSPSIDQLSTFLVKTMERYRWRHMAILVDRSQAENRILLENLERTISQFRYSIPIERKLIELKPEVEKIPLVERQAELDDIQQQQQQVSLCSPESKSALLEARRVARVFLFLISDHQFVRRLLLCAHELQMSNGEFVFLAIDMGLKSAQASPVAANGDTQLTGASGVAQAESGSDKPTSSRAMSSRATQTLDWYSSSDERNNPIAKRVFQSLMVFSVELPIGDEFSLFVEQTLDMVQQEFPSVRFERSSVGPLAVAVHDSLLLAVEAHMRRQKLNNGNSSEPSLLPDPETPEEQADGQDGQVELWRPSQEPALMWNEHYSGGLIASMHINSNGDQELDYVLSDLEPELGVMRPVARYAKESRQIEPLPGAYVHWPARAGAPNGDRPPPDEPECGFNGDAERCVDRQNLYAALSIVLALAVLVTASALVSLRKYRNIRYQMQLDDYWWKINWEELQFIQATESLVSSNPQSVARALRSGGSVVSSQAGSGAASMVSVTPPARRAAPHPKKLANAGDNQTGADETAPTGSRKRRPGVPTIVTTSGSVDVAANGHRQSVVSASDGGSMAFGAPPASSGPRSLTAPSQMGSGLSPGTGINIRSDYSSVVRASNLAMYKNELVIVKQLNGTGVEVSRELLVDLRSMREHIHDNLARFVGLCLEPQRLSIVYEYCSRGSLQDMLLNESIIIDWTLKCSIIGDILNGLNFIHTTLLNYHGRLKSTNLVLDSRFTVKITDFGLQNLYSQLEALDDHDADSDASYGDDEGGGGELEARREPAQRDTLSLSVSQRAVGGPNPNRASKRDSVKHGNKRLKLKNRAAARHFWTAPEHLRSKDIHCAGSKKGDVYSLAVIMFELLTRREPYYYGTSAKPHWPTIKQERRAVDQLVQQQRQAHSASGSGPRGSLVSTTGASSVSRRAQSKLKRLSAAVGPLQPDPSSALADSISLSSHHSSHSAHSGPLHGATPGEPPAKSSAQQPPNTRTHHRRRGTRLSAATIDEEGTLGAEENGEVEELAGKALERRGAGSGDQEPIDAEEILDQVRMGLQPEPVRPHLPNFVLHEVNPKLVELVRECWHESPEARPTLAQIRNQMRKITKGMASRNYLDNLLERLQNYAADLERIVDAKSSDIVEEKFRTEELLYQLLPKFVAERLKRDEPIVPQVFDGVTIFFSDIVGFEKYASVMSPGDLVDLINSIYSCFESVITSFDVTKIETIIDQFLVASGISLEQHDQLQASASQQVAASSEQPLAAADNVAPAQQQQQPAQTGKSRKNKLLGSLRHSRGSSENKNQSLDLTAAQQQRLDREMQPPGVDASQQPADQSYYRRSCAEQIARMALCLRDQMKSFHFRGSSNSPDDGSEKAEALRASGPKTVVANFNIRIGIHSGKVCAGIVGVKRPKFCLIGDTVNVASRMHTNSKANKIQVSADTKELLSQVPGFSIEPRGKIEVKGKGMMETYWLESSF